MTIKKFRETLPFLLIPAIVLLFLGFFHESLELQNAYRSRIEQELKTSTALLVPTARDYMQTSNIKGLEEYCREVFDSATEFRSRVSLFDSDGKVLFDTWNDAANMDNHRDRPEFQKELKQKETKGRYRDTYTYQRYSTTTRQLMVYCITGFRVSEDRYLLRTAITVQDVKSVSERLWENSLSLLGISVIFALTAGYAFFYVFSRPTFRLRQAAQKIVEGNLGSPLPIPRSGSLREISVALGTVSARLQRQALQFSMEKEIRDAIFAAMADGVILLDHDGKIVDINTSASSALDVSNERVRDRRLTDVWRSLPEEVGSFLRSCLEVSRTSEVSQSSDVSLPPGESSQATVEVPAGFSSGLSNRLIYSQELEIDLPTGKRRIHLQIQRVQWAGADEENGLLLVFHDLTALRKLEAHRRDFVANVSHEIKTPLTVIMGAVEALEDGAIHDPVMAKTFLDTLSRHARRLQSLLEDVLSLSRLECQTRKEDLAFETRPLLEPVELAVSLCQPQAQERKIKLTIDDRTSCPATGKNAAADVAELQTSACARIVEPMIEQALINLLSNAIKYTNPGDEIEVRLEYANAAQNRAEIHVIDHGPGIAPEHLERVFERFYRVDASRSKATGGTGLGLAIVKHIILLHGGTVRVESRVGQGCDFIVELPTERNP